MNDPQSPTVLQAPDPDTVEHLTLLRLQLAAARAIIRKLQGQLTAWEPLQDAYARELAGHVECRFAVIPLDQWVMDIVRSRGGRSLEDAGAVADWAERHGQEG